jgi:hypothetical protein
MTVVATSQFNSDGRMTGCYVYMLMCADSEHIHIKVGLSQDPLARALALRNGNPLEPETMAYVELPSRYSAMRLERELHEALAKWRTVGEWFRFVEDDKSAFNVAWKSVFEKFSSPSRKLEWTKINVPELVKQAEARSVLAKKRFRRCGPAYRDAVAAGMRSLS